MNYSDQEIFELIPLGKDRNKIVSFLYNKYLPKLSGYIKSRGGSKEDADDLFQESIIIFYKKVIEQKISYPQYRSGNFILGVAKNLWIDKKRREKVEESHIDATLQQPEPLVETVINDVNTMDVMNEVLGSLGQNCQEILSRVIFYSLSLKDIAEELGYSSEASVKTTSFRCRQKLIEKFKDKQSLRDLLLNES